MQCYHLPIICLVSSLTCYPRVGPLPPHSRWCKSYTLFVAVDSEGSATGDLYMDDENTFDYQTGQYALRRFSYKSGVLTGTSPTGASSGFEAPNRIERILIIGAASPPHKVTAKPGTGQPYELSFEYDTRRKTLTIRKPDVAATEDFVITVA